MFENYAEFKEHLDTAVKTQGNQGAVALAESLDGLAEAMFNAEPAGNYLTLTRVDKGDSDSAEIYFEYLGREGIDPDVNMEYSLNGGPWTQMVIGHQGNDSTRITMFEEDSVRFRGTNNSLYGNRHYTHLFLAWNTVAQYSITGDITSLLNKVGGDVALPANCFRSLFSGDHLVGEGPNLPSTVLSSECYNSMFSNQQIESYHVATLNDSANIFKNNSACTSLTIDAETPPTIGSDTITGLKADCAIYVPAASVDAYKAAQYWSARADYIQAKP